MFYSFSFEFYSFFILVFLFFLLSAGAHSRDPRLSCRQSLAKSGQNASTPRLAQIIRTGAKIDAEPAETARSK
jgi:hypothetical protein